MVRILGVDIRRSSDRYSTLSISDPAFAAWLRSGDDPDVLNAVSPYTVWGLSAVQRAVSIISSTIASLPMRTYERGTDGTRVQVESEFDDPYPGLDGMTRYAWVETVLLHLLLWRNAYLWHRPRADGFAVAYQPVLPDTIEVRMEGERKRFFYREAGVEKSVGSEQITHIPGPSLDGVVGHPLLYAARYIFSGGISGDKAAAVTLRRGIRLAGLLTPGEGEDIDPAEGDVITQHLRSRVIGEENAGDIAFINRRLKLSPWTPTNVESQWAETREDFLGEVGRLFGIPPHLLGDTEKQTSWGTGVAEQNTGFARYTLMGWTSRIEQVLTLRLPEGQFVEFDYKGLLQGTPAEEIELLIKQVDAGLITVDEARRVMNLPPLSPIPDITPIRQEATA